MTEPTKPDPADEGEQDADYWTQERMRDAVPMPLPAEDEPSPRRRKSRKETPGPADSGPPHRPADEPEATAE